MDISSLYNISSDVIRKTAESSPAFSSVREEETEDFGSLFEKAVDNLNTTNAYLSDAENEKVTYAALVGIEKAKSDVKKLTNAAVNQLDIFENSDFLKALALSLVNRNK